jgi:HlyD family secretion protein
LDTSNQPPKQPTVGDGPPQETPGNRIEAQLPLAIVKQRTPAVATEPGVVLRVLHKVRWLPLLPLIMLTGGVIAMYFQPPGIRVAMRTLGLEPGGGTKNPIAIPASKAAPKATAGSPATRQVVALARLVPEGELRTVAPPFGAGDARITTLKVEEGAKVSSGDVLAILDNEGQLKAVVDAAQANLAQRTAALEQTRAQVRASLEEANAALARAEAIARNAQADFERVEQLAKRGISSEAALGRSRTTRDETAREVERLKATVSRFQSVDVDKQPDVAVAISNLSVARSELARSTQDLDKAYVRAPIAGTVLTVLVRPGEKPGAAGILKLGNLDHMKAEIEVFQTQIGYVAIGDAVLITADSLPRPLEAKVVRIGLEVGRQTLVDPTPAANTDARVVKVQAVLTADSSSIAQRFTNLQVIAHITTQGRP